MSTDDEIAASLEQAATALRQRTPQRNWIGQFRDGEVLTASDAAKVAARDAQTIRRWCEAREIEHPDRPLGFLVGTFWLVDKAELLNEIEKREDLHARRKAETRLRLLLEERRAAPQSIERPECAAG